MTIPYERTLAVINTEKFLKNLADPKVTPGLPAKIRGQAKSLLRHYPSKSDLHIVNEGWKDKFYHFVFECPFSDPESTFLNS